MSVGIVSFLAEIDCRQTHLIYFSESGCWEKLTILEIFLLNYVCENACLQGIIRLILSKL